MPSRVALLGLPGGPRESFENYARYGRIFCKVPGPPVGFPGGGRPESFANHAGCGCIFCKVLGALLDVPVPEFRCLRVGFGAPVRFGWSCRRGRSAHPQRSNDSYSKSPAPHLPFGSSPGAGRCRISLTRAWATRLGRPSGGFRLLK
jgi:hypothetical protein